MRNSVPNTDGYRDSHRDPAIIADAHCYCYCYCHSAGHHSDAFREPDPNDRSGAGA